MFNQFIHRGKISGIQLNPKENKGKVPLIVFGTGQFGKDLVELKGNRREVRGFFWRALKRGEAVGDLLVVKIDE